METSHNADRNPTDPALQKSGSIPDNELKAIAYSRDALIPGFYAWLGSIFEVSANIADTEAELTVIKQYGKNSCILTQR
jgi:hypothetical protein